LRALRNLLVVAVAVGIAVSATWEVAHHGSHAKRIAVTVSGRTVGVAPGTTFRQLVGLLDLRAPAGDLLDVEGHVLQARAYPGQLLLDGQTAPRWSTLRTGDRITTVSGRDRTEPRTREVVRVAGGMSSDPQFFLARTPGSDVVDRGARSHELVSVQFRPNRKPTVERAVALTFDDGPSPEYTPRVLAVLRRLRVPATFFIVGYLAAEYPALVLAERHAGMSIGNHSYNHPEIPPFDELPPPLVRDEIALANEALVRAGVRPRLFRPPGGSTSPAIVHAARDLGERIVLWSVDPTDWRPGIAPKQIIQRVLAAVHPGSIVILHDGGGDRSATVAALPGIVKGIRRKHLRLVAIGAR
jgi:peptidoglycan/xylan/chitin deacetylase (PgdA/CDA1 family)